jgi:hypothetical protein
VPKAIHDVLEADSARRQEILGPLRAPEQDCPSILGDRFAGDVPGAL